MSLRAATTGLVLIAAALAGGCGSNSGGGGSTVSAQSGTGTAAQPPPAAAAPAKSVTVGIKSFKYKPVTVTVKAGGRVRWTNSDTAAHTATADDRSFDTETIEKGKTRVVAMTKPGTYAYHCDFHPFMKATVVVK
jgi:plastocyanin